MKGHPDSSSSDFGSLVDVLRQQAIRQSSQRVFTFLLDGEIQGGQLTYGELDRRARSLGALLQRLVTRGQRVLLLYPPGLDYVIGFFGCLYAGAVAVPAYPPRPNRTQPRLKAILDDARPSLALATPAIRTQVEPLLNRSSGSEAMRWSVTDDLPGEENWQDPGITRDSLALLQYTSGSTANPRGVMITHANLLDNAKHISSAEGEVKDRVGVFWLPPYHDMGLIGGIIQPVYYGCHSVLMPPLTFLQRPIRWLQAISHFQGTHSAAPNFAYDLCSRRIRAEQRKTLDLSSWRIAYNGAEPVRHETLETFAATFGPCGFRRTSFVPAYGLAEATLMVSAAKRDRAPVCLSILGSALEQSRIVAVSETREPARPFVSCGSPSLEKGIVIVDPDSLNRCAPDEVGEIWVSGPGVARGYWNRPKETMQTFGARLSGTVEGPFLRTGDLGFLRGGELFVTGRLKDLVIIDGRNHFAEDIEHTVQQGNASLHPGSSAAFSVDIAGRERLVIGVEVDPRSLANGRDMEGLVGRIRHAVVEQHDVQVHTVLLLKAGSLLKTSSGKIQRNACRTAFLNGQLDVIGS